MCVVAIGLVQVTIAKECLGGREGWIIGRPPTSVLYGQPVDTALPPELHWALMNGGTGQDPPPTLMMHSQRRAKEVKCFSWAFSSDLSNPLCPVERRLSSAETCSGVFHSAEDSLGYTNSTYYVILKLPGTF